MVLRKEVVNEKFYSSKSFAEYFYSFFELSKARLMGGSATTNNTQKNHFFNRYPALIKRVIPDDLYAILCLILEHRAL